MGSWVSGEFPDFPEDERTEIRPKGEGWGVTDRVLSVWNLW